MLQGIADALRDRLPSGCGSVSEREVYAVVDPTGATASGTMDRLVRFLNDVQPTPWVVSRQAGYIEVASMGSSDVTKLRPPFEIIKAMLRDGQSAGAVAEALSHRYGSYAEALRKVAGQIANLSPASIESLGVA